MKIYTKTGDDGTTGLFGGTRVRKDDARLECYGTIDELNAAVGLAETSAPVELKPLLRAVQNELFVIGSHLATPQPRGAKAIPPLEEENVGRLEKEIDFAETQVKPLREFILPGGSEAAARLHLARTICRRAERLLVTFAAGQSGEHAVEPILMHYINRLSDWLFVQARWANSLEGVADVPWEKTRRG